MKKYYYILFFIIFLLNKDIISQSGWFVQNSGTNYDLYGVTFINGNSGTSVGTIGTILHTSNGGD